jgi:hypothetical protein
MLSLEHRTNILISNIKETNQIINTVYVSLLFNVTRAVYQLNNNGCRQNSDIGVGLCPTLEMC